MAKHLEPGIFAMCSALCLELQCFDCEDMRFWRGVKIWQPSHLVFFFWVICKMSCIKAIRYKECPSIQKQDWVRGSLFHFQFEVHVNGNKKSVQKSGNHQKRHGTRNEVMPTSVLAPRFPNLREGWHLGSDMLGRSVPAPQVWFVQCPLHCVRDQHALPSADDNTCEHSGWTPNSWSEGRWGREWNALTGMLTFITRNPVPSVIRMRPL